jgi:succinyl-CoA synthetase beta subunit
MDIETVAAENPDAIHKLPVDVEKGLDIEDAKTLAKNIGFLGEAIDDVI